MHNLAAGGRRPIRHGAAPVLRQRASATCFRPRKTRDHPYWSGAPCSMLIDEVETWWSAIDERDDWAPFHAKIAAVRDLGKALA